jgi:hypothetical protein
MTVNRYEKLSLRHKPYFMKSKLLFSLLISVAVITSVKAQTIPNYSFESWAVDTNYLDLTLTTPVTLDTSISYDPVNWTTSNEVTNGTIFHNKQLVTQSGTSYTGSSAIQLRSDSVSAQINGVPIEGTVHISFVCPGFAVCGNFPINLSAFVNLGSTFNPALLAGAGIPITTRKASIGGYMKYAPVGGDTAYIIAVLRQGSTIVAQATYTRATTDAGYTYFEAPFVYQNCLIPDTMVYTISSGNPYNISGVVLGTPSGLHVGSALLVDSIFLGDTAVGFYGVEPIAVNDSARTIENSPVSIPVLNNDQGCEALAIGALVQPMHGTVAVSGDSIVYTPAINYSGADTFSYNITSGSSPASSNAIVAVKVIPFPLGINSIAEGKTAIYPNPASNKLYVTTTNPAVSDLKVYDMLGNVLKEAAFTTEATIDISSLTNGLYIMQFSGRDGKPVSSSRFTVIK